MKRVVQVTGEKIGTVGVESNHYVILSLVAIIPRRPPAIDHGEEGSRIGKESCR